MLTLGAPAVACEPAMQPISLQLQHRADRAVTGPDVTTIASHSGPLLLVAGRPRSLAIPLLEALRSAVAVLGLTENASVPGRACMCFHAGRAALFTNSVAPGWTQRQPAFSSRSSPTASNESAQRARHTLGFSVIDAGHHQAFLPLLCAALLLRLSRRATPATGRQRTEARLSF